MRPSRLPAGGTADPIRLLIINPNSNEAITAQIRNLAQRTLGPGTEGVVVDLPAAPLAIQSPADRAIAEPLAIARIEQAVSQGFHGAVLACFDDIAIIARGRLPIPIIDAVDASLTIARTCARRYAIVTTFEAAVPRIRALVARHGLDGVCTVHAAGIGVTTTAHLSLGTQEKLREIIGTAIGGDGAEAIILGSGALAGRAPVLAEGIDIPVIDSIEAAIRLAAVSAAMSCRDLVHRTPVAG